MRTYIILLMLPVILIGCKENEIRTVAPYSFIDMGDSLDIRGGWNLSATRYESTAIHCEKSLGVCADFTVRLVSGHLHIAPMLWKIRAWQEDVIIGESGVSDMHQDQFLYINQKNQEVFIFEKSQSEEPFDISDLDSLVVTEKLQNTFYQR